MKGSWAAILGHCFLIHVVAFTLRPAATYRALEMGGTVAEVTFVGGMYAVLPMVCGVWAGRLLDRWGPRAIATAGSLMVLGTTVVFWLWASSLLLLALATALLGLGHLCCVVAQQVAVASISDARSLDSRLGHYTFVGSTAQMIAPLLLLVFGGTSVIPDTRGLFLTSVGLAVALTAVGLLLGPIVHQEGRDSEDSGSWTPRRAPFAAAMLCGATMLSMIDLLTIYLPILGAERGLSASFVGILLSLRAGAGMASRLGYGVVVRRFGRSWLLVRAVVVTAVCLAIMAWDGHVALLVATVAVAGFGLGVAQPLTMAWVIGLTPSYSRGRVLALRLVANRFGQSVTPLVAGVVAAGTGVAGVLGTCAVITGSLAWVAHRFRDSTDAGRASP